MDPSYEGSPGAYSVVYKDHKDGKWVWQSWFVDKMFHNHWGELMAIAEAVNMAVLRLRLAQTAARHVDIHVFTDSLLRLDYLERNPSEVRKTGPAKTRFHLAMTPLRSFISKLSHKLQHLGASLTQSYIPGHNHDVAGHVIADAAAYSTSASGAPSLSQRRNQPASDSSEPSLQLKCFDEHLSRTQPSTAQFGLFCTDAVSTLSPS